MNLPINAAHAIENANPLQTDLCYSRRPAQPVSGKKLGILTPLNA
jgi:hypothetical protein